MGAHGGGVPKSHSFVEQMLEIFPESIRNMISVLGEFIMFMGYTLYSIRHFWRRKGLFIRQCEFIGVSSSNIIAVAALFMGGVLGYQLYVSFHYFGAEALLGGSVGVALFRELAPVLAAIMVTGRAGAAMAAEIASMRVSEQVDALEVMAVSPLEYLVMPRIIAGTLMMPLLAVLFALVASIAGALVSCSVMGLDYAIYWEQYAKVTDAIDIFHCLAKSAVFGFLLTWIGCYCGMTASGGAKSVGNATQMTVVSSCLTILFMDYILTSLLPLGHTLLEAPT